MDGRNELLGQVEISLILLCPILFLMDPERGFCHAYQIGVFDRKAHWE
jgi:hypothetical protein